MPIGPTCLPVSLGGAAEFLLFGPISRDIPRTTTMDARRTCRSRFVDSFPSKYSLRERIGKSEYRKSWPWRQSPEAGHDLHWEQNTVGGRIAHFFIANTGRLLDGGGPIASRRSDLLRHYSYDRHRGRDSLGRTGAVVSLARARIGESACRGPVRPARSRRDHCAFRSPALPDAPRLRRGVRRASGLVEHDKAA
jgi:hypothetical protein